MPDQVQNTLSWVEIETSHEAQIETMRRIFRTTDCLPEDPVPRCFWKRAALLYVAENRCQGFFGFGFAGTMRNEQRHCITASIRSGRHHKNVRMEYATAREKQLKGGSRKRKLALIEDANPQWRDLFADICA